MSEIGLKKVDGYIPELKALVRFVIRRNAYKLRAGDFQVVFCVSQVGNRNMSPNAREGSRGQKSSFRSGLGCGNDGMTAMGLDTFLCGPPRIQTFNMNPWSGTSI